MAKVEPKFKIGDIVYIVTDPDQSAGMVTCITWWGGVVWSYTVVFGFDTFDVRQELLTKEKIID
jgi:hypothetical protein